MTADGVLELLDRLRDAGVRAWVDGGWGVDALVGTQTRPHADLDLVVALADVARIRASLEPVGYALAEDERPVRFVMRHPARAPIDFHTVAFDAEGGGVQPQPHGGAFRYPPEGFTTGAIGGRSVPCVSAPVQLLCHLGYAPTEKDAHDVLLLHRSFGLPLPAAYARFDRGAD
jgi:lincosamide nucleotidyltransferase A/C/D/E